MLGSEGVGGASEAHRKGMAAGIALSSHLDLFGGPSGNRTRVSALRVSNPRFCKVKLSVLPAVSDDPLISLSEFASRPLRYLLCLLLPSGIFGYILTTVGVLGLLAMDPIEPTLGKADGEKTHAKKILDREKQGE